MSKLNSLEELKKIIDGFGCQLLGLDFFIYIREEEPSPFFCILCKNNTTIKKSLGLQNIFLHLKSYDHLLNFFNVTVQVVAHKLKRIRSVIAKNHEHELNDLFSELIALIPCQNKLPLIASTVEDSEKYLKYLESVISLAESCDEELSRKMMALISKFEERLELTQQAEASTANIPLIVKYSKNFEDAFDKISEKYKKFKANPASHPLFNYEWDHFYLKNPNQTGIWQSHWRKRLNELEQYEILQERIAIRTRQGLPCEAQHEVSLEKFEVEEAEKCMFLKAKRQRDTSIGSNLSSFSFPGSLTPTSMTANVAPSTSKLPADKTPQLKRKSVDEASTEKKIPKKSPAILNINDLIREIEEKIYGSASSHQKVDEGSLNTNLTEQFDLIDLTEDD